MSFKTLLCGATLAVLGAAPVWAQSADDSVQDVITVTGLRPVALDDVTSSVAVLDADLLSIRNAPYLADQLRAVPGVAVSRSGAKGGLTQIRMRGAEANHTLVLVDGIEISDPTTGETDFGLWSGLNAQRIEVLRGEHSVLYGSDAIGGVVSVATGGQGLRGAAEYGSLKSLRANAAYDSEYEQSTFGGALSFYETEGVDVSGIGPEKDGSRDWSGLLRGGVELSPDWRVNALLRYGEAEVDTDSDTDFDGLLNNVDRKTQSTQSLAGIALNGATGAVSHQARASWSETQRENFADSAYTGETIGQRVKASYSPAIEHEAGDTTHSFAALVDFEQEDYERKAVDTLFGDPNQSVTFETVGLAGEYRLSKGAFAANASFRHDFNDGAFEDADTWRVGAAYAFGFGGKLRASVGQAVKNPTFTELFGFTPSTYIGNPDLVPETSLGFEIGWDQQIGDFTGALIWFSAELEDEIHDVYTVDPGDPDDFFDDIYYASPANRSGKSKRDGVEVMLHWQASDQLGLSAMTSQISSTNDSGADEIRVPEWTGSFALDWQSNTIDGMRLGAAADYVGEQLDTDFGTFQTVTLDEYVLVSATVEIPVTDRISLTARGENLLDEDVMDVFGYHGSGSSVFFGVRLR